MQPAPQGHRHPPPRPTPDLIDEPLPPSRHAPALIHQPFPLVSHAPALADPTCNRHTILARDITTGLSRLLQSVFSFVPSAAAPFNWKSAFLGLRMPAPVIDEGSDRPPPAVDTYSITLLDTNDNDVPLPPYLPGPTEYSKRRQQYSDSWNELMPTARRYLVAVSGEHLPWSHGSSCPSSRELWVSSIILVCYMRVSKWCMSHCIELLETTL
ncbi:hypothetical protein BS47DRAFT_1401305 [Hydnum rufescens UP504]|uniref:Uncharacterized protein n=1 Tax=Hydnum rufescens UP504 TaxID=1448309 RepID=A0A9P6DMR4_9AGAM|nr:hypothetical protein BS47DRAFT_1401305 [Hydnum rufescens UP504]